MSDATKIIIGLAAFLVLLTFPVWYAVGAGEAMSSPELEIVTDEKECIEPVSYMRAQHMELLNDWKQSVVRQGVRIYVAGDGDEYTMSLTGTCLDCHSNKKEFCDRCHGYAGVQPGCWECHIVPEGD